MIHPTVDETSSLVLNSDDTMKNTAFSDDDEVSEILQRGATDSTEGPETVDEVGVVITEVIMSKTFTESIEPDREFVPIGGGGDEVPTDRVMESSAALSTSSISMSLSLTTDRKSDELGLTGCEVQSSSSTVPDTASSSSVAQAPPSTDDDANRSTTSAVDDDDGGSDSRHVVGIASRQVRDLAGEFYRLQELLDNLTNPRRADIGDPGSSSSEENVDDSGAADGCDDNATASTAVGDRKLPEQIRVVYRYRIHTAPSETGRRWIRRTRSVNEDENRSVESNDVRSSADGVTVLGDRDDAQIVDVSTSAAVPDVGETGVNATSFVD